MRVESSNIQTLILVSHTDRIIKRPLMLLYYPVTHLITLFRPWWDVMEDSMMYFFVVMSEYIHSVVYLLSSCLVTRYGDTAHDLLVQHSTGLHYPSQSLANQFHV